jgi:predicted phosphohydrolase
MDVFGPEWADHQAKLESRWRDSVGAEDLVLLCGDLSWAMTLEEARPDLDFIESLPGTKYVIRGNHDFWYSRPGRVRAALGPSMHLIRFDAAVERGVGICGVRSWPWPGHPEYDPDSDERHWRRALLRFGMSLEALGELQWDVAVAMFHYPPLSESTTTTELCAMAAEAGVSHCVYGHLHGADARDAFEGEVDGVTYRCVSADRIGFTPALLFEHAG